MLFRVDIASGEVMGFDVAPDGIIFVKDRPQDKTGFRTVGDHVEYSMMDIPGGWLSRLDPCGKRLIPLETPAYQQDGYCDNVLWTRDEVRARDLGKACTLAKERARKPTQIF